MGKSVFTTFATEIIFPEPKWEQKLLKAGGIRGELFLSTALISKVWVRK